MSIDAVSWALNQQLPPPEKLVLISLADHHNKDTGICIPGQESVAKQTCMSVRTVQRHLKQLEGRGLIVRQPRFRGEGRGRTSDAYILQGDNLTPMFVQGVRTRTTNTTNQDDQPDTGVGVTVREPKENRKARATAVPDGWQPPSDVRSDLEAKYPQLNISQEADKFTEWHGAKGSKFVDHAKAFRLWCRNAVRYQAERKPSKPAEHPGWGGVAPY